MRPAVLRAGAIEVDVAARSCAFEGTRIELTPREFSVIEYLLRRQNEVVPKREILEHVWDFAFDGGHNVVEVHVSSLRRKLGSSAIETVVAADIGRVAVRPDACVVAASNRRASIDRWALVSPRWPPRFLRRALTFTPRRRSSIA